MLCFTNMSNKEEEEEKEIQTLLEQARELARENDVPTELVYGADAVATVGAARLARMGRCALVVTGARAAGACGALDAVRAALARNGQAHVHYAGVPPNPTVACVYAAVAAGRAAGADFVVGVGGGSPLDAAKAVALLLAQPAAAVPAPGAFFAAVPRLLAAPATRVLPLAAVPTTAGSGSEVTPYAIVTNDAATTKTSVADRRLCPAVALLDPQHLASVPAATARATALDTLCHCVEAALAVRATPASDAAAGAGLRALAACWPALAAAPAALAPAVRARLLLAATLGGIAIARTGTVAVHALGYSLTYFRGIAHGRANALVLASYLRLVHARCPAALAPVLAALGARDVAAVAAMVDRLLGAREAPPTRAEIDTYAPLAAATRNIANSRVAPSLDDIRHLYAESFGVAL